VLTDRAVHWLCTSVPLDAAEVVGIDMRPGSTILFCHGRRGVALVEIVCRLVTNRSWATRDPLITLREFRVCSTLRNFGLEVPEPLAVDVTGADVGVPACAMTWLPGTQPRPPYDDDLLRACAGWLRVLHSIEPTTAVRETLGQYRPHEPASEVGRPGWLNDDAALWDIALTLYGERPPHGEALLHRDYRIENILADDGGTCLVGVVDWTDVSVGAPHADIGHFRANLALEGCVEAVDVFTGAYLDGDDAYSPQWDVYAIVGMASQLSNISPAAVGGVRTFLRRACAKLT
jgi:Phosphotransferase enzyme family